MFGALEGRRETVNSWRECTVRGAGSVQPCGAAGEKIQVTGALSAKGESDKGVGLSAAQKHRLGDLEATSLRNSMTVASGVPAFSIVRLPAPCCRGAGLRVSLPDKGESLAGK